MRIITLGVVFSTLLGLAGCAKQSSDLYLWNYYQPEVYEYLQSPEGDVQPQITKLEAVQEDAKAANRALPPGFHAHLGLLYARLGQADKAAIEFNTEKALFPESTAYMDFLLSNKKGVVQ